MSDVDWVGTCHPGMAARVVAAEQSASDAPLLQIQLVLVLTVVLVSPFELRASTLTVLALAVL